MLCQVSADVVHSVPLVNVQLYCASSHLAILFQPYSLSLLRGHAPTPRSVRIWISSPVSVNQADWIPQPEGALPETSLHDQGTFETSL